MRSSEDSDDTACARLIAWLETLNALWRFLVFPSAGSYSGSLRRQSRKDGQAMPSPPAARITTPGFRRPPRSPGSTARPGAPPIADTLPRSKRVPFVQAVGLGRRYGETELATIVEALEHGNRRVILKLGSDEPPRSRRSRGHSAGRSRRHWQTSSHWRARYAAAS